MRRFFMVCRLGSFLLGLFILLSLLTGGAKAAQMAAADTLLVPEQWTYDGRFRDMSGLRCADAVKTSFDTGLLEGRQADRFDAVSELTNAQILVISARLYDRLTGHNTVWWHWRTPGFATLDNALTAPVYLSSANAITADGQILNIDGRGNRLAAMVYGIGKTVYIVAGTNKICPNFDSALSRARNTAAVQNMQRFDGDQPCHELERCVDCRSKSRGCNALLVLWGQMMDMAKVEVVLIDEPLGL